MKIKQTVKFRDGGANFHFSFFGRGALQFQNIAQDGGDEEKAT